MVKFQCIICRIHYDKSPDYVAQMVGALVCFDCGVKHLRKVIIPLEQLHLIRYYLNEHIEYTRKIAEVEIQKIIDEVRRDKDGKET